MWKVSVYLALHRLETPVAGNSLWHGWLSTMRVWLPARGKSDLETCNLVDVPDHRLLLGVSQFLRLTGGQFVLACQAGVLEPRGWQAVLEAREAISEHHEYHCPEK